MKAKELTIITDQPQFPAQVLIGVALMQQQITEFFRHMSQERRLAHVRTYLKAQWKLVRQHARCISRRGIPPWAQRNPQSDVLRAAQPVQERGRRGYD